MAGVDAGTCFKCGTPLTSSPQRCRSCGKIQSPKGAAPTATTRELRPQASVDLVLPGDVRVEIPAGGRIELGREAANAAIVDALREFPDVSRQHLIVTNGPTGVTVLDLQSSFGSWIDDERLDSTKPTAVPAPQRIRLGSSCYVKVVPHGE